MFFIVKGFMMMMLLMMMIIIIIINETNPKSDAMPNLDLLGMLGG
jgi:hypothetical protein